MRYLIVLMLVLVAMSAGTDLEYWEDEYPYHSSEGTWHGINFMYSDFDTSGVGWDSMEIHSIELRFRETQSDDSVIVFVINASSLPPHCSLEELYYHPDVVIGFTITPQDGMHDYVLTDPTIVDDSSGQFWVLIYTEKAWAGDDGAQLCIDRGVASPPYHTYQGSDPSPCWSGVGLIINEAHVTIVGGMLCMALEPATWGSLKSSF